MNKEQQALDQWFKDQNWPYWTPHEILARLMEETGEFARLVNHQYGPKKKKDSEEQQDFEDELGDILYTLACFADSHVSTSTLPSHVALTRLYLAIRTASNS